MNSLYGKLQWINFIKTDVVEKPGFWEENYLVSSAKTSGNTDNHNLKVHNILVLSTLFSNLCLKLLTILVHRSMVIKNHVSDRKT